MTDYITRKAAIENVIWAQENQMDEVEALECTIAADVVPVVHRRWNRKHRHRGGFRRYTGVDDYGETHTITVDERIEIDDPYCSVCGKLNESVFLNYCPNCGAQMDGGVEK